MKIDFWLFWHFLAFGKQWWTKCRQFVAKWYHSCFDEWKFFKNNFKKDSVSVWYMYRLNSRSTVKFLYWVCFCRILQYVYIKEFLSVLVSLENTFQIGNTKKKFYFLKKVLCSVESTSIFTLIFTTLAARLPCPHC